MNLLTVRRQGKQLTLDPGVAWTHPGELPADEELILGLRPERLKLQPKEQPGIPVEVALVEKLGAEVILGCRILHPGDKQSGDLLRQDLIFVRVSGNPHVTSGTRVSLGYAANGVNWYSTRTGEALHATESSALPHCA